MKRQLSFVGALAFGPLLFLARPAQAGLADCGNIHVEANAMCQLEVEGGCTAHCEPVSFQAQCAANYEAQCSAMCHGSVDASCMGSCDVASCQAECDLDPPHFDCSAQCEADGSADCDAQCAAGDGHGECVASCQASFSAHCTANCPPPSSGSVDCEASCQASCQGRCEASANVDCEAQCQSSFSADCEASLQGGCEAKCQTPDGALFCDGQYVDYGDHLQKCEAALASIVHVTVHGSASSGCGSNSCSAEAEGSAKASCAMAPGSSGWTAPTWLVAGFGLLAFGARRRRR